MTWTKKTQKRPLEKRVIHFRHLPGYVTLSQEPEVLEAEPVRDEMERLEGMYAEMQTDDGVQRITGKDGNMWSDLHILSISLEKYVSIKTTWKSSKRVFVILHKTRFLRV